MPVNRRQFISNAALTAAALKTKPQAWSLAQQQIASTGSAKAYGSGYFGKWIKDEFGLPAFHYTCDQTTDPKAVTQVNPGILTSTEHVHQVGNDRIVAIASNFGHVRVRQDEGAPKFLNDYSPDRGFRSARSWKDSAARTCTSCAAISEPDSRILSSKSPMPRA